MIVKVSVLIAASLAACAVSLINNNSTKKQRTIIKSQDGAYSETQKIEDENTNSDISQEEKIEANLVSTKMVKIDVTEREMLNDLAGELEQRKVYIEGKLLELHGLKEEKSYSDQLRSDLDDKLAEIRNLSAAIASLREEKSKLKEEIKECVSAAKKLYLAKKAIAEMEREIDGNERRMKGRVSVIEERVCEFRDDDRISERNGEIEKMLKGLRGDELRVGEMRRRNKQLELEKRESTVKLLGAQDRLNILSNMTEGKVMLEIEDEIRTLKHGNEGLSSETDRMQKERFEMVEELVYQRWLNSCLRFEKQIKDNPPRESSESGDPKNNRPLNSNEEINPPISYPSSSSLTLSSSRASSTESDQVDTATIGSSLSGSQESKPLRKSFSFMKRINKWGCKGDSIATGSLGGKEANSKTRASLARRFSASMAQDQKPSMRRNYETTSPFVGNEENGSSAEEPSKAPRVRRVSFSDLVRTHYDMPISSGHERALDNNHQKNDIEKPENTLESSVVTEEDSIEQSKIENNIDQCGSSENEAGDQMMQHLFNVVVLLFVFIFLFYYLYVKK